VSGAAYTTIGLINLTPQTAPWPRGRKPCALIVDRAIASEGVLTAAVIGGVPFLLRTARRK
jgi:hypothetical protein